jgi:hypothetical protein
MSTPPSEPLPLEAVEIKFAVRLEQTEDALGKFAEFQAEPKHRRLIRFYDTRGLDLFEPGVILRTRVPHKKEKDGDSTVKVRGELAAKVGDEFLRIDPAKGEAKRERDWVLEDDKSTQKPARDSVSITMGRSRVEIESAGAADDDEAKGIAGLFKEEQENLIKGVLEDAAHWTKMKVIGPISAEIWKLPPTAWKLPNSFSEELTVELWGMKGLRVIEFSCKVEPERADDVADRLRDALTAEGLRSLGKSKTELVLRHLLVENP